MAKGRPKPLYGAKKYDRALLKCTTQGCDNEFYVSRCTTPARRKCKEHFSSIAERTQRDTDLRKALKVLGLI